ncbi:MAG: hypothetical protein ACRYFX_14290 [Janthinobacterium lividum]
MPVLLPLLSCAGLLLSPLATVAPKSLSSLAGPPYPVPKGAVQGDFDGNGVTEYVWLVPPPLPDGPTAADFTCVGPCTSVLRCSNPAFKPYRLPQSLGGELTRFAHLGPGQRDYLGILPEWFTSCWQPYYVLTYRQGRWQFGVPPFETHCNQWEVPVVPIERDRRVPGHVLVRYSVFEHENIVVKTKSLPLK